MSEEETDEEALPEKKWLVGRPSWRSRKATEFLNELDRLAEPKPKDNRQRRQKTERKMVTVEMNAPENHDLPSWALASSEQ